MLTPTRLGPARCILLLASGAIAACADAGDPGSAAAGYRATGADWCGDPADEQVAFTPANEAGRWALEGEDLAVPLTPAAAASGRLAIPDFVPDTLASVTVPASADNSSGRTRPRPGAAIPVAAVASDGSIAVLSGVPARRVLTHIRVVPRPAPSSRTGGNAVRYEITELDVFSLGKVVAAIYAAAGLISWLFVPLFALMPTGGRGEEMFAKGIMMFFFLAAPLMYAIFGFIFGVVAALVYNLLARTAGGLRFTLREDT